MAPQGEEITAQATNFITTTETPPLLNPLGFDPSNPEDWSVYNGEERWAVWRAWMQNAGLAWNESDFCLGDFTLIMPFDDAAPHFPSIPLSEHEEVVVEGIVGKNTDLRSACHFVFAY